MFYIVCLDLAIFFRMKNLKCVLCFFFLDMEKMWIEQMSLLFYNAKLL